VKHRRYGLLGVAIGAVGLAIALLYGHRVTVALCGALWGSTITLAALTRRGWL
jgi:hypothetical protein